MGRSAFAQGTEGQTGRTLIHRLTEAAGSNIEHGHYYTAFALARRAAILAERELFPDEPLRLTAEASLGFGLLSIGAYGEAHQQLEAVLGEQERVLGREHPGTLATARGVAACLREMGDYAAAKERLEAVLAKQERKLGPSHPDTEKTRAALAEMDRDASTAA